MSNHNNNEMSSSMGVTLLVFMLIWVIAGIIAFVYSLVCFGRSGSTVEKILGLLLAIFFGPLYFIFLGFNKSYCR